MTRVLLLVLAHRDHGGVVDQDVRGHQRRVGEQPKACRLGILARGLVLPLGHPAHPAHARDTVEDPGQLGMGADL
jgi:hypothetical protein